MLDRAALEDLYRSHGHVVLRRARAILHNDEDANDVLHEAFASLLHKPEQFHGRSKPTTFLYAMTTNICLHKIRDRANRARLVELHVKPHLASSQAAPADALSVLRDLLQRLPADLGAVAVYAFVDEMTHEQIAEVLGCSRRHVGVLLERFREQARKLVLEAA